MNGARREGRQEGIEEGRKAAKKEDAKKMLARKIDIDLIIEITGLTKEEIENL